MNHGHMRGNAHAFDLSTLKMLSTTLDNGKEKSLLHYMLLLCKSKVRTCRPFAVLAVQPAPLRADI